MGGGGGAGGGGFNVHSVYSMQDRFGDVWRWVSEGGTVCETSCAALDSRLKDGTEQEMYGGGNGHILAGTRYYPPHYPPRAPISSSILEYSACLCPVYQRGFQEKGVLWYWTMMVDMLDGSGSRIRGLVAMFGYSAGCSKTSDEALSLAQSASQP